MLETPGKKKHNFYGIAKVRNKASKDYILSRHSKDEREKDLTNEEDIRSKWKKY